MPYTPSADLYIQGSHPLKSPSIPHLLPFIYPLPIRDHATPSIPSMLIHHNSLLHTPSADHQYKLLHLHPCSPFHIHLRFTYNPNFPYLTPSSTHKDPSLSLKFLNFSTSYHASFITSYRYREFQCWDSWFYWYFNNGSTAWLRWATLKNRNELLCGPWKLKAYRVYE